MISGLLCYGQDQSADKPGFYIWQRKWNEKMMRQIEEYSGRKLFPLFAECSTVDGKTEIVRTEIYPAALAMEKITPVIRIHAGLIPDFSPEKLAAIIKSSGKKSIQLDLDCPEKELKSYAAYIESLKALIPDTELSITALPCHLNNLEFKNLASKVNYYVVQLHGLYTPESIEDDCIIMKRDVSMKAIAQAQKLGIPFMISIPAYSHQLVFDKISGRYKGKNQSYEINENSPYLTARQTELDFAMLHELLAMKPSLQIIWFRMPFQGEHLILDMETIKSLENGVIPEPEIKIFFERNGNSLDLFLTAHAIINSQNIQISLTWTASSKGESEFFRGTRNLSENRAFGILPSLLSAPLPPCGTKSKIASFHTNEKIPEIQVKQQ